MKINKKGIIFWITGYSGSGKTAIAKNLKKKIENTYGPTLEISGDNLREIFKLKKYDTISREKYAMCYSKFCKKISDQGVNVIFSTISLFNKIRILNRKNLNNYIEIYIKTDLKKIMKRNIKKKHYLKKDNIVGLDISAQLPQKPDIIIQNRFNNSISHISNIIFKKINKLT